MLLKVSSSLSETVARYVAKYDLSMAISFFKIFLKYLNLNMYFYFKWSK